MQVLYEHFRGMDGSKAISIVLHEKLAPEFGKNGLCYTWRLPQRIEDRPSKIKYVQVRLKTTYY